MQSDADFIAGMEEQAEEHIRQSALDHRTTTLLLRTQAINLWRKHTVTEQGRAERAAEDDYVQRTAHLPEQPPPPTAEQIRGLMASEASALGIRQKEQAEALRAAHRQAKIDLADEQSSERIALNQQHMKLWADYSARNKDAAHEQGEVKMASFNSRSQQKALARRLVKRHEKRLYLTTIDPTELLFEIYGAIAVLRLELYDLFKAGRPESMGKYILTMEAELRDAIRVFGGEVPTVLVWGECMPNAEGEIRSRRR